MQAQEFLKWMEEVGARNAADVVRILDIGRNQAQQMVAAAHGGESIKPKRVVLMAMAAAAAGLAPWGQQTEERE